MSTKRKTCDCRAGAPRVVVAAVARLISYDQAARFLGVTKRTVRRAVADGNLVKIEGPTGPNGSPLPLLLLGDVFLYHAATSGCLCGGTL